MSLRDTILAATDSHSEPVEVKEWGCTVYVKSMSAAELDSWQDETYQLNGKDVEINRKNIRARLLVRVITEENGDRVFSDNDAEGLGGKNTHVIDRLYKVAEKVNAIGKGDIEELAKN